MSLVSLSKVSDPKAKSLSTKYRLYLADYDEVDIENWPDIATGKKATIDDDIVFLSAATSKWQTLDCNVAAMNPNAAVGESPTNGKLTLTPVIEGITDDTLGWVYANAGKQFIVVWERCSDKVRFIGGSPCSNGLTMKYTSIGSQEGNVSGIALSFEGNECAEPFLIYEGSVTNTPPSPSGGGGVSQ